VRQRGTAARAAPIKQKNQAAIFYAATEVHKDRCGDSLHSARRFLAVSFVPLSAIICTFILTFRMLSRCDSTINEAALFLLQKEFSQQKKRGFGNRKGSLKINFP